jgi:hypothetical protein
MSALENSSLDLPDKQPAAAPQNAGPELQPGVADGEELPETQVAQPATPPPPAIAASSIEGFGVKQVTTSATEADLEARIDGAIRLAFPLLPRDSVQHQTKFTFSFGGKEITVDGKGKEVAQSRADIILYFRERPLAVLELKRSGLALSDDDSKQGLSYARVLNPSPPLVVISNGQEVRFIETHTGNTWQPKERTEQTLTALVQSAARVAASDLKIAVTTLMATNPDVWVQAVRQTTAANILELSGDWKDRLLPFVRNFQIPRKATQDVRDLLQKGSKLVIVEGAPLAGKSNVLRELAQGSINDSSMVVLFVESEGSDTVLQQVADTLTRNLDWPVTREEARAWLKNLSQSDGPRLAIVIDGVGLDLGKSRDEIVDLTSVTFGSRLSVVLELDDVCADAAVLNSTGRQASAIGRRAQRVQVASLDDSEFASACEALWNQRLAMANGAQSSPELRLPWVLRAIGSRLVEEPQHGDFDLVAGIPPLLSVDLIHLTRNAFEQEIRISFRAIAAAALEDAQDLKRPISLILESMGTYVVRRKTLKKHLAHAEIERLRQQGYIRPILHESGEDVFVVCVPELVACEAAWVVAGEIAERVRQSPEKTAKWLSTTAANVPLGDIVAGQAIIDAAMQGQAVPFDLIAFLMECSPRKETLKEGSRLAMHLPGAGTLHLTVQADGLAARTKRGVEHFIPFDRADSPNITYTDIHAWLILSHLAGVPCAIGNESSEDEPQRLDPSILLEVCKCPVILRRPSADPSTSAILTHEIDGSGSFVCHKAGIVEPITLSLFKFLSVEGRNADEWIQTAVASGSVPMLARLDIAVREISNLADTSVATFAKETLEKRIRPAMSTALTPH